MCFPLKNLLFAMAMAVMTTFFSAAQYSLDVGWGMTLDVNIGGLQSSSLTTDNFRITYTPAHMYSGTTVHASLNTGNLISPCENDEFFDAVVFFSITLRSISDFNPDGSYGPSQTIDIEKISEVPVRNSFNLSMSSQGVSAAAYTVGFMAQGFCAAIEDSVLSGTPTASHFLAINPALNFGTIGDIFEGESGRDINDNDKNAWNPSSNSQQNPTPFPPGQKNNDNNDDFGSGGCSLYGRPEYGVNMQSLCLGVNDREFFQAGMGPSVDISRFYNPKYTGIFGKGWKCTQEIFISGSTIQPGFDGPVVITPERGERYFFNYSHSSKRFTPSGNRDSLYLEQHKLVWLNREKSLIYTFDTLDNSGIYYIHEIKDLFDNKISYAYNAPGKISSITDDAGRIISFSYNQEGIVSSFLTPDGRSSSYLYDGNKRLIRSTDLEGMVSEFEYDSLSNISSLTFEGKKTLFGYQTIAGRSFISSLTDPMGNTYTYDLNMWTTFSQNTLNYPDGKKIKYHGDHRGNTIGIEAEEKTTWYTYDNKGRLTEKKFPLYDKVQYEYNDKDQLIKATYNSQNTETMSYHSSGNLASYTDRMGKTYKYTYNNKNLPVHYINPDNDTTRMSYNDKGKLVTIEKPDGSALNYEYDIFGNITRFSDQQGTILSMAYDITGHFMESLTDASGNMVRYEYDHNKRITGIKKPDNTLLGYEFGCCGQEGITDEYGNITTFARNGLNAITSINLPGGKSIKPEYNSNNYLTSVTNSSGNKYLIRYNENNMPVTLVNYMGDSVRFSYNQNNMINTVTDELGNTTGFEYSNGFLYSTTDAAGKTRSYWRDKNDRIWKINNSRLNSSVSYLYDYRGAVTKKTTSNTIYDFSYDKGGRLKTEKSGVDSTSYSYDLRGKLIGIKWQNNKQMIYAHDPANNIKSMTYPDGAVITYDYDAAQRIIRMIIGQDSVSFGYDVAGKLIAEKRTNNTNSKRVYDNLGKLTRIEHLSKDTVMIGLDYEYNLGGNISSTTIKFPYQLSFSGTANMNDASYNNLNQIISENAHSYTYDDDGNLIAIAGIRQLKANYTDENLIDSLYTSAASIKYKYNGLQQAVSITKNGVTRRLYYDLQDKLLFETDLQGQIICKYFYAGNRLTAMADHNGAIYFYHFDKIGSTVALTASTGNIAAAYWYTPFGEKLSQTGNVENRFTFIGALNVSDEFNGFYRMGKRVYNPYLGRFMQRDPKGMVDGTNLYAYALNNPLVHIDPEGTDVANGTANLFTCEGPVYGDDFISDDTYKALGAAGDLITDLTPGVGDVKAIAKTGYFLYNKEYLKAGLEMTSLGIGKYAGGKLAPVLGEKLGEGILKDVANAAINKSLDITVKGTGEAAADYINKNTGVPASPPKSSGPTNTWGPPAGIHY